MNARDSNRNGQTTTANTALFVTAAVIIFCIAGAISIAAFVDDPEARIGLIAIMLAQIPVTAGLLRVLVIADKSNELVTNIDEKTDKVLNGDMDKKLLEAARKAIEERWGKEGKTRPLD